MKNKAARMAVKRSVIYSTAAAVSAAVAALLINLAFWSPGFANGFCLPVAAGIAASLRCVFGWWPFSAAEIIIYAAILAALTLIVIGVFRLVSRLRRGGVTAGSAGRMAFAIVSRIALIAGALYLMFALTWGTCYARLDMNDVLGLDARPRTAADLYETARYVLDRAQSMSHRVRRSDDGVMLGGFSDFAEPVTDACRERRDEFGLSVGPVFAPKPVLLSRAMSYTSITGIYVPFTGECNVNWNAVPFTLPFTMAHELSHSAMVAREDEANFAAFLICQSSDNAAVEYSGWAMSFLYLSNALYNADSELHSQLWEGVGVHIRADFSAQNDYIRAHSGPVAEFTSATNDSYLKSQRQQDGELSYGRMVDLMIAWYFERS